MSKPAVAASIKISSEEKFFSSFRLLYCENANKISEWIDIFYMTPDKYCVNKFMLGRLILLFVPKNFSRFL